MRRLARLVLEQTDHTLLVGEGAAMFARAMGFAEESLLTETARRIWLYWRQTLSTQHDWLPPPVETLDPAVIRFFKLQDDHNPPQDGRAFPRSEAEQPEPPATANIRVPRGPFIAAGSTPPATCPASRPPVGWPSSCRAGLATRPSSARGYTRTTSWAPVAAPVAARPTCEAVRPTRLSTCCDGGPRRMRPGWR
ncbi:MAG: isoaspartyl peptidase/L-asparaginase [Planctomycetaceae bacterium]